MFHAIKMLNTQLYVYRCCLHLKILIIKQNRQRTAVRIHCVQTVYTFPSFFFHYKINIVIIDWTWLLWAEKLEVGELERRKLRQRKKFDWTEACETATVATFQKAWMARKGPEKLTFNINFIFGPLPGKIITHLHTSRIFLDSPFQTSRKPRKFHSIVCHETRSFDKKNR